MKQIAPKIGALYEDHLNNKALPKRDQFDYRKWLRYYSDFCFKYKYDNLNNNNFRFFIEKMKEKGQSEQEQKQAFHAISLYYELGLADAHKDSLLKDKNQDFSIKKERLKGAGANWVPAYDSLKAEISLRHYSPKRYGPTGDGSGGFRITPKARIPAY